MTFKEGILIYIIYEYVEIFLFLHYQQHHRIAIVAVDMEFVGGFKEKVAYLHDTPLPN